MPYDAEITREYSLVTRSNSSAPGRHGNLRKIALLVWIVVVLGVSLVIFVAAIEVAGNVPQHSDFATFYAVGTMVRDGQAFQTYDHHMLSARILALTGSDLDLRWLYPPGMLLLTWPTAFFSPAVAYIIWLAIGLACMALVAWRLAPHPLTLILLPFCPAVTFCAVSGQVGFFATALAGGGFLALNRRPTLAGFLLGLLALKIQLALVVPFCLLAGRHYRALVAMAITAILVQLPGLALTGIAGVPAFLATSPHMLASVSEDRHILEHIPTLYSLLVGASATHGVALTIQVIASLAAIAAVWFIWRRSDDIATRSLAWAAGSLLATPYVFDYDLVIFALPLAAMAWQATQHRIGSLEAAIMTLLWFAAILVKPAAAAAGFQLGPFISAALLAYAGWRATRLDDPVGLRSLREFPNSGSPPRAS
jgi:alpha-1,2-mannosyltransferase